MPAPVALFPEICVVPLSLCQMLLLQEHVELQELFIGELLTTAGL